MNVNNFFVESGRLTKDPIISTNANGTGRVRLTLAVQDNFRSTNDKGEKVKQSQFLNMEALISKDKMAAGDIGVYGHMHSGDKITVQGSIRNNDYTDKNSQKVYSLSLFIENVNLEESKSVTDRRMAMRASAADAPADGAAASEA